MEYKLERQSKEASLFMDKSQLPVEITTLKQKKKDNLKLKWDEKIKKEKNLQTLTIQKQFK